MLILYLVQQDKQGGSHMAGGCVWGMCPAPSGKKDAMVNKEYCYSICNVLYVHIPVAVSNQDSGLRFSYKMLFQLHKHFNSYWYTNICSHKCQGRISNTFQWACFVSYLSWTQTQPGLVCMTWGNGVQWMFGILPMLKWSVNWNQSNHCCFNGGQTGMAWPAWKHFTIRN